MGVGGGGGGGGGGGVRSDNTRIRNVSAPLQPYIYFTLTRRTFFCLSYKIVGRDEKTVLTFRGPLSAHAKTSGNRSAKDVEVERRN